MPSRKSIACLLLLTALARPCDAQEPPSEPLTRTWLLNNLGDYPDNVKSTARRVVLENAEAIDPSVRQIVGEELLRSMLMTGQNAIQPGQVVYLRIQNLLEARSDDVDAGNLTLGQGDQLKALIVGVYTPSDVDGDVDAIAGQRWEEIRQKLEDALRTAQRRIVEQNNGDYRKRRDAVARRVAQTENELSDALQRLREVDGDSSLRQLREQLASTTATLRELALDRVSAEARREAISVRIDELRREAMKDSQDNPLIEELEKVAEIRERQLKVMREAVEGGVVSEGDLARPEVELATARVEVLKAKRAPMAEAAGSVLRELNNEISHLIVRLAEIDARTKALQETANELREETSVEAVAQRESLQRRVTMLQDLLDQAQAKYAELEAQGEPDYGAEIAITPLNEALSLGDDDEENDATKNGE
jgi:hypothetical protein